MTILVNQPVKIVKTTNNVNTKIMGNQISSGFFESQLTELKAIYIPQTRSEITANVTATGILMNVKNNINNDNEITAISPLLLLTSNSTLGSKKA